MDNLIHTNTDHDSIVVKYIAQLYHSIEHFDRKQMQKSKTQFEKLLISYPNDWIIHYYTALSDYALANNYSKTNQTKDEYLNHGINHLEQCININEDFADAYALLSLIYSSKISIYPQNSTKFGIKASSALTIAKKIDPDNPRIFLALGRAAYYKPRLYGGGLSKAKNFFSKALALFEEYQPSYIKHPSWGHEEVYAWLSQIALRENKLSQAKLYCIKALNIKPNYFKIKQTLLPEIMAKMNNLN